MLFTNLFKVKSNGDCIADKRMPLEALQPNCYRWQLCHKVAESMGGVLH